jgi:2,3-diketo-5-methylthio-1-phosphopentane phosphatase
MSMPDPSERPIVFLDFDGTISRADVVDAILERYALDGWQQLEEAWQAGRLGSRECLRGQMALVRATPGELDELIDGIAIDTGVVRVLDVCRRHGIAVHVISDGFDVCIHRMLARLAHGGRGLPGDVSICSSRLHLIALNQWRATFPFHADGCVHGCATCKPSVMNALNPLGGPSVFVGDGLSDRYACEAADVVFARDRLRTYCEERSLPHIPYDGLAEVASFLEEGMRLDRRWRQPAAAQASA